MLSKPTVAIKDVIDQEPSVWVSGFGDYESPPVTFTPKDEPDYWMRCNGKDDISHSDNISHVEHKGVGEYEMHFTAEYQLERMTNNMRLHLTELLEWWNNNQKGTVEPEMIIKARRYLAQLNNKDLN